MTEPRRGPDRHAHESGDVEALSHLADEVLPALIARLRASRLGELEVRSDDWRVRLRRERPSATAPASTDDRGTRGADEDASAGAAGTAGSPGVGYFSPAPDVSVGTAVRSGDPLGWVDVLGIRQEVSAPIDGIVGRLLAASGEAVEYGQPLAQIEGDAVTPGRATHDSRSETAERAAD